MKIIPISFDMKAILNDKYYNAGKENRYLVQTCSQSKDTGIKLPEVHGTEKGIDPNLKPEWIVRKSQKLAENPRSEQDKVDPLVQEQTQVTGENHVKEQLISEQRKHISTPQVEQNISRGIEQGRYTIPKHLNRPQVEKNANSKLSRPSNETPTKTTR